MNKSQSNLNYKKGYGKNFANLRKKEYNGKEDYTVRGLAEKLKIASSTISLIEKEQRVPTIEQINMYKDFFDVSLDYLVGETNAIKADMKEICEYTGLSEKAIKKINAYNNMRAFSGFSEQRYIISNVLNTLIESDLFLEYLFLLGEMNSCSEKYIEYGGVTIDDDKINTISKTLGIPQSQVMTLFFSSEFSDDIKDENYYELAAEEHELERECELLRYRLFKCAESINEQFDRRKDIDLDFYQLDAKGIMDKLHITQEMIEKAKRTK